MDQLVCEHLSTIRGARLNAIGMQVDCAAMGDPTRALGVGDCACCLVGVDVDGAEADPWGELAHVIGPARLHGCSGRASLSSPGLLGFLRSGADVLEQWCRPEEGSGLSDRDRDEGACRRDVARELATEVAVLHRGERGLTATCCGAHLERKPATLCVVGRRRGSAKRSGHRLDLAGCALRGPDRTLRDRGWVSGDPRPDRRRAARHRAAGGLIYAIVLEVAGPASTPMQSPAIVIIVRHLSFHTGCARWNHRVAGY